MDLVKRIEQGTVRWLGVGAEKEVASHGVPRLVLDWDGIIGDRHAGGRRYALAWEKFFNFGDDVRNFRQVTIVSAEELAATGQGMGLENTAPVELAAWTGNNILLEGLAGLSKLPAGSLLRFAHHARGEGAAVFVTGVNTPCRKPVAAIQRGLDETDNARAKMFVQAAHGRRGLLGLVARQGEIRVGDTVTVWAPRLSGY